MKASYLMKFFSGVTLLTCTATAIAQNPHDCSTVPSYERLKETLAKVVKEGKGANGGLGNQEWGTVVNRDGIVCAVVYTGPNRGAEWPGSRVVSAEKANTANAFSTSNFALSTGNLFAAAQPGQSLYSIVSPPNAAVATTGDPQKYGQSDDPMVGKSIGGVIVFGGGLPLYNAKGQIVGALGVSGDTSCTDHVIAWKARHALGLDAVPMGVAPGQSDNLILDMDNGTSRSGFGHPVCKGGTPSQSIIEKLNQTAPVGPKH
jgi:uncharacterized protein GlcG (DUF336 family)